MVNRLYLSPISRVPGPKLAALTWGYEFYYDVILGGQYTFKILDLHRQYGPIIRINPSEIHIADKSFFHTLYAGSPHRREKWSFYAKQFGAEESAFSTIDHELHRPRRAALNPFFATAKVRELQHVIDASVDNILRRLSEHARVSKEPLNLVIVFAAFTNDVINEYAFARSDHMVDRTDFGRLIVQSIMRGTHMGTIVKHFPWVLRVMDALPEAVMERWVPGLDEYNHLRKTIRAQIGDIKRGQGVEQQDSRRTVFHEMLQTSVLPEGEKTEDRLAHDAQILVQGGTLTTSHALCVAVFHLLDQPSCLAKLRDELFRALPDPEGAVSLAELQQLRYLGAVVKESFRLGYGGTGSRLGRVAPDETLRYVQTRGDGKEGVWTIPPGTPMSMTPYQILTDEEVYPDPFGFHPERWLSGDTELQEHYWIVFNAGTRSCLGQNLAKAEVYLMVARLFRRWGGASEREPAKYGMLGRRSEDVGVMRLYETTVRDTQMAADRFVPVPYSGSKGVRVVLETSDVK